MIKYLGSKRKLASAITQIAKDIGARSALDLFTGTTRVAREFKKAGIFTIVNDLATYSEILGRCYISTDADSVDMKELKKIIKHLEAVTPEHGYFTETFCEKSRYFQPKNGEKIDAIRNEIDSISPPGDAYRPILLTSLMEAADRVDSTVGLQMAYLKQYADRSNKPLTLRVPELLPGTGLTFRSDAAALLRSLPHMDLAYLDPPYNQHRYFTNYHIWETLIRWDAPDTYGIAQKRIDAQEKDGDGRSAFNVKRTALEALRDVVLRVDTETVILSYSDEGFITFDEIVEIMRERGNANRVIEFQNSRHVGSSIGIHNLKGVKVGEPGKRTNTEYLFVNGPKHLIDKI